MIEQWLSDPKQITLSIALLAGIVAYHRITRWYFDKFTARSDAELARTIEQCKSERDRNERLLSELERVAGAGNVLAEKVKPRRV